MTDNKTDLKVYDAFNPAPEDMKKKVPNRWQRMIIKVVDWLSTIFAKAIGLGLRLKKILDNDTIKAIVGIWLLIVLGTGLWYNIKWAIIYWPVTIIISVIFTIWALIVKMKKSKWYLSFLIRVHQAKIEMERVRLEQKNHK